MALTAPARRVRVTCLYVLVWPCGYHGDKGQWIGCRGNQVVTVRFITNQTSFDRNYPTLSYLRRGRNSSLSTFKVLFSLQVLPHPLRHVAHNSLLLRLNNTSEHVEYVQSMAHRKYLVMPLLDVC